MGVCGACYIFHKYYKIIKKESYEKSDGFIDDDYDYDDDYSDDAFDVYVNYTDFITDVKLEVKNTQYTKSKRYFL